MWENLILYFMYLNVGTQKRNQRDRIYKWRNHFQKEELGQVKQGHVNWVETKIESKSKGMVYKRKEK